MSERIDLRGFLSAYLAEAEEHLGVAQEKALAIEGALGAGRTDARAVRDLFRVLHTVKGLSSMVGVDPIVDIAHRMEALVRGADRAQLTLGRPELEAIFEGLTAIAHRLRLLSDGKEVTPAPAALLARFETGGARPAPAPEPAHLALDPELDAKLAPFEREQLVRGLAEGKRAVSAEFLPSPKRAAEGRTINTTRERVAAIAEVVKVLPSAVPPSDEAPGGLRFVFLLLTTQTDAAIADAVSCPEDRVRSLGTAASLALSEGESEEEVVDEVDMRARSMLRVDVQRVDEAMEDLSELIVTRSRLARLVSTLGLDAHAARELSLIVNENGRQLRALRAALLRIRMVPFEEVLARLQLTVRSLRRTTEKEVTLLTHADGAELDKAVAERVFPALVHLVRNAVDHGLETPEERLRAGKPAAGKVRVVCAARSNRHLAIEVSDDGAGIDREALAKRVGSPVSEEDLLAVLCRPGLSTRAEATTTSGRGMGMDIVKRIVALDLGGDLSVTSRPGEGTTFRLEIPLTVSILDAFIVHCDSVRYAVPVAMVEEIIDFELRTMVRGPGRTALLARRGETVPLVDLSQALGESNPPRERGQALVVRRGTEPVAFALDRVSTQQEAVVRPLVDPLVQVPGIAGSTDLGDGLPTLVLDLVALRRHGRAA